MKDTMYLVQDLKAKIREHLHYNKDNEITTELLDTILDYLIAIANDLEEMEED
jgi:hypothetical protein